MVDGFGSAWTEYDLLVGFDAEVVPPLVYLLGGYLVELLLFNAPAVELHFVLRDVEPFVHGIN